MQAILSQKLQDGGKEVLKFLISFSKRDHKIMDTMIIHNISQELLLDLPMREIQLIKARK